MKKSFYFYTTFSLLIILGLVVSKYIFGWTTPTQNPPAGNITLSKGALPAGSPGYVQFASSSTAFGGDSNLFWDIANKRLGIGTTTPQYPIDVIGNIALRTTTSTVIIKADQSVSTGLNADRIDGYHASDILAGSAKPTAHYLICTTRTGSSCAAPTTPSDCEAGWSDGGFIGYGYGPQTSWVAIDGLLYAFYYFSTTDTNQRIIITFNWSSCLFAQISRSHRFGPLPGQYSTAQRNNSLTPDLAQITTDSINSYGSFLCRICYK